MGSALQVLRYRLILYHEKMEIRKLGGYEVRKKKKTGA